MKQLVAGVSKVDWTTTFDCVVKVPHSLTQVEALGKSMKDGILLPWNEAAGGGMAISNVTFVNFKNACIRGCAHCGRGGSPVVGDGAFETRYHVRNHAQI